MADMTMSLLMTMTLPKLTLVTIAVRYEMISIIPARETLKVYDLLGLS